MWWIEYLPSISDFLRCKNWKSFQKLFKKLIVWEKYTSSDIRQNSGKKFLETWSYICHTISSTCMSGNHVRKSNIWIMILHRLCSKEFFKTWVDNPFFRQHWLNVFAEKFGRGRLRKYLWRFHASWPTQLKGCLYEWLRPASLQIFGVRILLLKS